jgi:hypothetical protein
MPEVDVGRPAATENGDQSEVISFLSKPEAYPTRPAAVEQRSTHAAIVFLAGADAFKIKRAVRYSYLDFSTLEKRRAALNHELEINKPNAPDIYLSVVAITRDAAGRLAIGGKEEVVEWALHMRRFDDTALLDAFVQQAPLPPPLCSSLADAVFEQHRRACVYRNTDSPAQMASILAEVTQALRSSAAYCDEAEIERLLATGQKAILRLEPLLKLRAAEGYVRLCHGDLHLGNIVLIANHPVLFDAIEFDDRLATIDTLYDLAFLLMDLVHRQQLEAANRVLNYYLWRSQSSLDLQGLAALPLFLSLRAAVRAMVGAQRLEGKRGMSPPAGAGADDVQSYLGEALAFLNAPRARLVTIGGLSGSGKSTLGAALAPRLGASPGALHIRSDLERKAHFGAEEFERLSPASYTPESNRIIYDRLFEKAMLSLKAGHSVVLDAVFAKPEERARVTEIARSAGVPHLSIWLEASARTLKSRVSQRQRDASDATQEVVEQQLSYDTGNIDWTKLDSSDSPEQTLDRAQSLLEEHFARP